MPGFFLKKIRAAMMIAAMVASALAGCASKGNNHAVMDMSRMSMDPIKVELTWSPADASANQEIIFKVEVTQGGDVVDDADEVLFEIVNDNDSSKKLELKGELDEEGKYTAAGTLEEAGVYHVTSHVTARTQHSMPTKPLTVKP
ncbi:FixH family protein [Paenibacillus apii]|uniref:FixH family protein n=1 Tax=Paenibacillus apii TaxID=1850370 RepID=UPI00143A699E|nr:FixH family protein [Paenibacillus apii]NJJ37623.1 hypothetical protein [Paenibacillus apii]